MALPDTMPPAHINFGLTADDYSSYRAGFPDAFFDRIQGRGLIPEGTRLLDLGSGTGTIARGMAERSCQTVALDISLALLKQARGLNTVSEPRPGYLLADAESTPLASNSFDLVTAGQCWHWFNGIRAALEARRVLIPGGTLIIAHFDWLPLAGNVVSATESLILRHNPSWSFGSGNGFYPRWLEQLRLAGFVGLETFSFDLEVAYSHIAWRGRIRASAGVGAALDESEVRSFDDNLAALLGSDFPAEPLYVPHRVFTVIGKKALG